MGLLPRPSQRRTWTFVRGATVARASVVCETAVDAAGKPASLRLSGEENKASRWVPAGGDVYSGTVAAAKPLTLQLSRSLPVGRNGCPHLPPSFVLICRAGRIQVLGAGAALVVGQRVGDVEIPPNRWSPSAAESIDALRCEARTSDADASSIALWSDAPFALARGRRGSPGVEFAFENSDLLVQKGGFRWMP